MASTNARGGFGRCCAPCDRVRGFSNLHAIGTCRARRRFSPNRAKVASLQKRRWDVGSNPKVVRSHLDESVTRLIAARIREHSQLWKCQPLGLAFAALFTCDETGFFS